MVRQRPFEQPWVDDGTYEANLRSATVVLRFALSSEDVVPSLRKRLINDCLWFITEASGKYTTRFRSRGVLELEANGRISNWRSRVRHEHVVTRRSLAERLESGEDPASVLEDAVACVVTVEEHDRLAPFDRSHEGWDRYREAGIEVVDMLNGETFA